MRNNRKKSNKVRLVQGKQSMCRKPMVKATPKKVFIPGSRK